MDENKEIVEAVETEENASAQASDAQVEAVSGNAQPEENNQPAEPVQPVEAVQPVTDTLPAEQPKKKGGKGKIIIAIVAVLVLAAVAAGAFFLIKSKTGSKKTVQEYDFYVKDNELYYMAPGSDPVMITDSLFKDDDDADSSSFTYNAVEFTNNNKRVFYAQKIDTDKKNSFSLCYKQLDKPDVEPVKLADNVKLFTVNDKGTLVIYLDSDGSLYKHDLEDREKILSDVEDFWISDDCLTIMYLSEDGGLYTQGVDGEKDKLDSDVESVEKVDSDLAYVYYLKDDGTLCYKHVDEDKVKIDSDVKSVTKIIDNNIYYTKENESKETTLADYVIYPEDLQKSDKAAIDKFDVSTDAKCKSYCEAKYRYEAYEILKGKTVTRTDYSLYYYNGEKSNLVNSSYLSCYDTSKKSILIKSNDKVKVDKIKIEDFINKLNEQEKFREELNKDHYYNDYFFNWTFRYYDYFNDFKKEIDDKYSENAAAYLIENGTSIAVEVDDVSEYILSNDGSTLYYFADEDEEKNTASVYKCTVSGGAISKPEVYELGVSTEQSAVLYDFGLMYYKDVKDESGDLYVDKNLVDYDVNLYLVTSNDDIIYYTNTDYEDTLTSTVYIYRDGEKRKIADEVFIAWEKSDGTILFVKDYSKGKGDLYMNKKDENTRVDYDVSDVFKTNSATKYRRVSVYSY